ncbi:unnamed protein product [Sphagnum tenellum]
MFSLEGFLQYCIVTRLLVILFVNPSSCVSHAQPSSFTFVNFNSSYLEQIILVDDAIQWESKYILLDSVNTTFGEGRYYGCGKLIYKEKVQMLHPSTGAVASFKTSFTFTIFPPSGDSSKHFGHGFAFTSMEDNHTVGVAGDSMCVVTLGTQGQITNTFFAVEFDTYLNPYYDDPSDSHIGVNVNSFMSLTTYNLCNLIVYKGFLQETGSLVVVKRITRESRKGELDFIAEISVISQIRHRNLVQLRGWCQEKENLLLVYDYMSNKSLDKWLFETPGILDVQSPHVLQWEVRYNSVTGVAAAVHYLHEEWEQCIIHRDIKASNVLLDAQFQAHLGNFGLARFTDHDKSSRTTMLAGTLGPSMRLVYQYLKGDKSVPSPPKFEPMAISY